MATWGYSKTNGPPTWEKYYPIARGKRQSPVNIATPEAVYDDTLETMEPLAITYKPERVIVMKNHKHSLWLSFREESIIRGGPLTDSYRLKSLNLHWGAVDGKGSEHTVDGRTYSAELQFTHWNCKYGSYQEAADRPDGIAILAVLIMEGHHNCNFRPISEHLPSIKSFGSETCVKEMFNPICLLPGGIHDYWTYPGSETIPPLREHVTWIVFKHPVQYSHDQLSKLRSLHTVNEEILHDNFRRPMPLCERVIRKSFKPVVFSPLRKHVRSIGGVVTSQKHGSQQSISRNPSIESPTQQTPSDSEKKSSNTPKSDRDTKDRKESGNV